MDQVSDPKSYGARVKKHLAILRGEAETNLIAGFQFSELPEIIEEDQPDLIDYPQPGNVSLELSKHGLLEQEVEHIMRELF